MSEDACAVPEAACFLGLDLSTQGLKAVVINGRLEPQQQAVVNFDADLPEFHTASGVRQHADGVTVTSPPMMWVAALDLLFDRLRQQSPLDGILAVSGSGQQHGSVWLRAGASRVLREMRSDQTMRAQLDGIFAMDEAPIWMDASTGEQCAALERRLGGAQAVADLTGSRAYERFTGNQIAKIYARRRDVYDAAERIALVSSFTASLLSGDCAPIDFSDGSGMNLMDLRRRQWAPAALAACGDETLAEKLGPLVPSHFILGGLHPAHVQRYGFPAECLVAAFSGDNPCSLAGLRLEQPGAMALSLGTSDTLFGATDDPRPSGAEGHVFVSPICPENYMVMLVRKNGSVMREQVRDQFAGGSWDQFARALDVIPPGNGGRIGFYHAVPEITPPTARTGIFRFDAQGRPVERFAPEEDCRALVESQFLSLRRHAARIGLQPSSMVVTGGASQNPALLQAAADVFNLPVYVGAQADSAALGAAYRALHAWACRRAGSFVPFGVVTAGAPGLARAALPRPEASPAYEALLARYDALEQRVV
ncbi:MAG: xylulokinase [Kiritimatiellia bacterium]|nr:hypothetical protein [Lentisphaerota bacterium]